MDTTRLICVPDDFVKKLVDLWNSFLSGQTEWPDSPKIVTPKKKETTKSMMDVRPHNTLIAIPSPLQSLDQEIVNLISFIAPWPIRGSLAHRSSQDLYMFVKLKLEQSHLSNVP